MGTETTIAQGIHATNDSAGYDEACKRILSEKSVLARIMTACLAEYKDCDVNEIAEKYIEGTPQVSSVPVLPDEGSTIINGMDTEDKSVHEGTITYDIRFRAIVPGSRERISLIINVEAQNDFYPGYPIITRGVYYCSRSISSQYGREFTDSHYQKGLFYLDLYDSAKVSGEYDHPVSSNRRKSDRRGCRTDRTL